MGRATFYMKTGEKIISNEDANITEDILQKALTTENATIRVQTKDGRTMLFRTDQVAYLEYKV